MTPSDLDRLEALAKAATPGPRLYRPNKHDDWGWVRLSNGELIAMVRWNPESDLNKHRLERTDPAEHDARFMAACDPSTVLRLIAECRRKM